jgi:16S rRNA G966 N2-methylase RsmD
MLNKLFPNIDFENIQYDNEGLYSITNYIEADYISKIIIDNFNNNNKNLKILDGTGGLGGNTISFSKFFKNVTSIEINKDRYEMLKNNINLYKLDNIKLINDDSINFLTLNKNDFDIIFFDPPWGGPDYKKNKNLRLKIGKYNLSDIPKKISLTNKLLIFKLPFNYDFDEFSSYNYKLYKINKYYILILLL